MKKIITTIIMMLVGIAASAQIVNNSYYDKESYIWVNSYSLQIGDYVFEGSNFHGSYDLSYQTLDYDEAKAIAAFISRNLYALNKKFGVMIRSVDIGSVRRFLDRPPFETSYGYSVHIGVYTKEYDEYVNQQYREREERLNSLNTVL